MLVGYMRVSSADDRQTVNLQRDALIAAGVDHRHLHIDKASGARDDRLGRSLPHLLAIVTDLKARGIAFRSLTEQMDTTTPHGELDLYQFWAGCLSVLSSQQETCEMIKHSEEFKQEAVRIALTSGLPRDRVASDLGIGKSTLHKWISQYRPTDLILAPQADLARENERLRLENRVLREEREVLKKATQFFASQRP